MPGTAFLDETDEFDTVLKRCRMTERSFAARVLF